LENKPPKIALKRFQPIPQQPIRKQKRSHYPRTERQKPTHATTVALPERERSNPQSTLVLEQRKNKEIKKKKIKKERGSRSTKNANNALLARTQKAISRARRGNMTISLYQN